MSSPAPHPSQYQNYPARPARPEYGEKSGSYAGLDGQSNPAATPSGYSVYRTPGAEGDAENVPIGFDNGVHRQQHDLGSNTPTMYAVQQSSRSNTHIPNSSIDAPESVNMYDNASIHSRAGLTSNAQGGGPLHARFDSRNFPQTTHIRHVPNSDNSINGNAVKPIDFSEKQAFASSTGSNPEGRQLPVGYHTPPAFSRASSTGTPAAGSKLNPNNPNPNSPYGALGGIASKSDPGLQFAEGDLAKSRFARFWLSLMGKNIVIRWLIFILPVLLLLWIPGICAVTIDPTPRIWTVSLLNWSIWLTIVWLGWWAAVAVAMVAPHVLRNTVGTIAPELRHYIDYLHALKKSLAAFLWTLAMWISFQPLILVQGPVDRSQGTGLTLSQITKALFAFWICAIILLVEKFLIQVIAYNFHKTSYADRIADNKSAIRSLTTLYLNSRDIGRSDTLDGGIRTPGKEKIDPTKYLKKGLKSAKRVVTGTTTALGTVASEIVGERVLQSNSPASMVTSALSSAGKSRQLARRIFFSFTPSNRHVMLIDDIAPYFQTREKAIEVFTIFDKDGNGDVSLEEIEMACLDIHKERLSLSSSMRDLDSAVGRLDQILMSLYYVVAILIIIGLLNVSFSGFITSASAFILGLSWLIGSTSQEVLAAVVFLLAKHPYDVGDLVTIDGYDGCYVVKEIMLLSTVFKKTDGNITQMPHTVLNTKAIQNYRRSGPTSETFKWDVDFGTTFEQIERLRDSMLEFLEHEKRDYLPTCDISVISFDDQSKLTLQTSIPFKSNWSNSAQKSQRRNKWICALKIAMGQLQIWGPGGNGNPAPAPADPTLIKLLNPDVAAPPYQQSSPPRGSARPATTSSTPPPNVPLPPTPSNINLADEVSRIGLTNRGAIITDAHTDVFDYQGSANREEDSLEGPSVSTAQVQTADQRPERDETEAEDRPRFKQRDLELGKMRSARQQ